METEVTCPRCNSSMIADVVKEESGTEDIDCEVCGAVLELSWSDQGMDTEVDLLETPPVEYECPVCEEAQALEGVEEENGTAEIECDTCGAVLEIGWRDWTEPSEVDVLEKPVEQYYGD